MSLSVLFARVSTKEQAEEGYSLGAQVTLLRRYAATKSLRIREEFAVPESARGTTERRLFDGMMAFLDAHPDVTHLLCEKVDRLTRNFRDAVRLNDWLLADPRRQIHFVKQNLVLHKEAQSNEKFMWDMHVVFAKQYSNNLSEEARKGLLQKAREGHYPGSQRMGYRTIQEHGKRVWIIDERPTSDAPFLRRAYALAATGGYTLDTLTDQLATEGWLRHGKPIHVSTVHKLLTNPFYVGDFLWKGQRYQGRHPPLVSRECFAEVQRIVRRNLVGKYRTHSFPLGGCLSCGECGRSVVGSLHKGRVYYHCTRFRNPCRQRHYVPEARLEQELGTLLTQLAAPSPRLAAWGRGALADRRGLRASDREAAETHLRGQLVQVERRQLALYDDKVDGRIPVGFFDQKFREYGDEAAELRLALARLETPDVSEPEVALAVWDLSQLAADLFASIDSDERRRALVRLIFADLRLRDGHVTATYQPGFDLLALPREDAGSTKTGWQAIVDDFGTGKWLSQMPSPGVVFERIQEFLTPGSNTTAPNAS